MDTNTSNEQNIDSQPLEVQQSNNQDSFQVFLPTKNIPALVGYYFSIFSLIPLVGFFFAIIGLILGGLGLKQYYANPTPGAKGHALFAVIFSGIMLGLHLLVTLLIIIS